MNTEIEKYIEKQKSEWPESCGNGSTDSKIENAEELLSVQLPNDYKYFLKKYGAAVVNGIEILGLDKPEFLYSEPPFFTEQSLDFRNELPQEYEKIVVIHVDGSGNPIGFLPGNNEIFIYDFDFGGKHILATDFKDYLHKIIKGKMMGAGLEI